MNRRALVSASGTLSLARAGALLLQAAQFAVAARLLPRAEFAGFAAALALVTIGAALAEFGLTHTTVLDLTRRDSDERRTLSAAVTAIALLVPGVILLMLPIALLVLSPAGVLAFLVLLPWFAVSTIQLPFVALRRHQLRLRRLVAGEVLGRGLPLAAVAPVMVVGQGWHPTSQLVAIGAALLAGSLVGLAVLASRPFPRPSRAAAADARRLLVSAAPLGLTSGLSMVHVRVDQIVLSAYGLRVGLAAYAVAYRVLDAALALVGGAGAAAFPMLAHVEGRERAALARTQAAFLGAAALVMGTAAFALAPQLTVLIGGGAYPDAAWLVRLLCPALVLSTLNAGAAQVAVIEGKARSLLKVAATGVVANLALNVALDRTYGARAAALATVATELLGCALVARIARRALPGSQPWSVTLGTGGAFLAATFGARAAWTEIGAAAGTAVALVAVAAGLAAMWVVAQASGRPGRQGDRPRVFQVITKLTMGGAQETALRYALLDRERYDTVLVTGPDRDSAADLRPKADATGVRVITVRSLRRPIRPWADVAAVIALARLFRREGASIVHTHSSKAGLVGRAAARLAGVPTVLHTVHGWSFHEGMNPVARAVFLRAERIAARWTTRLVVVGDADRRIGLAAGIGRPDQYALLRSAIELERASQATPADASALRADLGVQQGVPLIGSITRLYPQKDPATFVRVAAAVVARRPDTCVLLVGDGPLRRDVERLVTELQLDARLRLLGWRSDVASLLASLDVFVSTARWEGLPRTIVEAAASEVPIVTTDVGSTSDVVVDGETGFLAAPGDVDAMATAVLRLLDDPTLARQLASAAALRVRSFGVETMLEQLDDLYRTLVDGTDREPIREAPPAAVAAA